METAEEPGPEEGLSVYTLCPEWQKRMELTGLFPESGQLANSPRSYLTLPRGQGISADSTYGAAHLLNE